MCDRILVFSTSPGHIVDQIKVDLPQPRNRLDPNFRDLVERIYVVMTARPAASDRPSPALEKTRAIGMDAVLHPERAEVDEEERTASWISSDAHVLA